MLQTYAPALGVGKLVRAGHTGRPRNQKLKELRRQALQGFGGTELAEQFLEGILLCKPRYAKDQMGWLLRLQRLFTKEELDRAVSCVERSLFGCPAVAALHTLSLYKTERRQALSQEL